MKSWKRLGLWMLILAFVAAGVAAPHVSNADQSLHAQPQLLALAAAQPEARLRVIVQKAVSDGSVEAAVARLGGMVTKDLSIIAAIAADIPARAVLPLSQVSSVRWVSLDAPVKQTDTSGSQQFTTWATGLAMPNNTSLDADFKKSAITTGSTIWFNSILKPVSELPAVPVKIRFINGSIAFTANGANYTLDVPDSEITYDPAVTSPRVDFDDVNNTWINKTSSGIGGSTFLAGMAYKVPLALPGGIKSVKWSGLLTADTPGIKMSWQWAAAVYSSFSSDYNALGVKPTDSSKYDPFQNTDKAGTPTNYRSSVLAGATGDTYSASSPGITGGLYDNPSSMADSGAGPNGTFGSVGTGKLLVSGLSAEETPGNAISKVELVLQSYVPVKLAGGDTLRVSVLVSGVQGTVISVNSALFTPYVGSSANAGSLYIDMTGSRAWSWGDFDPDKGMQVMLDQSVFGAGHVVYYDAIGLRVTSQPGIDISTPTVEASSIPGAPIDYSQQVNVFNQVIGSVRLITEGEYNKDDNDKASIAVVDSGVVSTPDLKGRVKKGINLNKDYHAGVDPYGHGTFVAGIMAGSGKQSDGRYIGVAPNSRLINVRVSDDQGMSTESDVVAGLQWVRDNKDKYKIRVVNLSLNSSVAASYNEDPLDMAVEILWFNGIVVVVSGGNSGIANLYPPANDPFVITVGATDDKQTVTTSDDVVAGYSAYGTAESGLVKPELVAPGTHIIGMLPDTNQSTISRNHPRNRVESKYFRMSGTSMSAPMVSAAVSLLLQSEPSLTPDQVKYRLMATANKSWPGYDAARAGAGYLDIYAAAHISTTQSANVGIMPTLWLARMAIMAAYASTNGVPADWNAVNWNAVNWNAVNWNAVNWNAVNWNAVNWNAVNWNAVNWNAVNWNAVNWNAVNWNAVNWNAVNWNAVNWNSDDWSQ